MRHRAPITRGDLNAYLDDELSPERRAEVAHYLATHPEAEAELAEYRRVDRALHQLFDPVLAEPIPPQLRPSRRSPWRAAAAAAGWLLLGGSLGWGLHPTARAPLLAEQPLSEQLVQPAAFAHTVYTTDPRHPVEVSAADEHHLVSWLSLRLHADLRAPDLTTLGYHLVGGRLLPATDRMAAQFMYERADATRITLYLRRGPWQEATTLFHFEHSQGLGVFYWVEGGLGYAVTGPLAQGDLLALAEAVFQQLRGEPAAAAALPVGSH